MSTVNVSLACILYYDKAVTASTSTSARVLGSFARLGPERDELAGRAPAGCKRVQQENFY